MPALTQALLSTNLVSISAGRLSDMLNYGWDYLNLVFRFTFTTGHGIRWPYYYCLVDRRCFTDCRTPDRLSLTQIPTNSKMGYE